MTTETITLERSGNAPLRFEGQLIAHTSGQFVNTEPHKPNNDWWEIAVYEVRRQSAIGSRQHAVAITYRNERRNGYTHRFAVISDGPPLVTIQQYRPLDVLVNFPPVPEFESRQRHLERQCRSQWETLVSAVLRDFPEVVT